MPRGDVTPAGMSTERFDQPGGERGRNTSGVQLLRKLDGLEHRLETLAGRVKSLERHTAELDDLRREIGNLKIEVEEFREAD